MGLQVTRHGKDTRPIALKLVCAKLVLSAANWRIKQSLGIWSTPVQRGFVPRRRLAANVVEADAWARILGMEEEAASQPMFAALDLKAAFPSVARQWIYNFGFAVSSWVSKSRLGEPPEHMVASPPGRTNHQPVLCKSPLFRHV